MSNFVLQAEVEETKKRLKNAKREIQEFILKFPQNEKIKQIAKRKKRKRKLKEDIQRNYKCLV